MPFQVPRVHTELIDSLRTRRDLLFTIIKPMYVTKLNMQRSFYVNVLRIMKFPVTRKAENMLKMRFSNEIRDGMRVDMYAIGVSMLGCYKKY